MDVNEARCPMCEYENKPCVGGAHASALWEDGIRTVEDYKRKIRQAMIPNMCDEDSGDGYQHGGVQPSERKTECLHGCMQCRACDLLDEQDAHPQPAISAEGAEQAVCAHCDLPFRHCKCLPDKPLLTKWITAQPEGAEREELPFTDEQLCQLVYEHFGQGSRTTLLVHEVGALDIDEPTQAYKAFVADIIREVLTQLRAAEQELARRDKLLTIQENN